MFQQHPRTPYKEMASLRRRFNAEFIRTRLSKERLHSTLQFKGGFKFFWENLDTLIPLIKIGLKLTRLRQKGLNNTIDYEVIERDVPIAHLPEAFEGYKILQLTDLHIDGLIDHATALSTLMRTLTYDACVITGDFRFLTYGQIHESMTMTSRLVKAMDPQKPRICILGNHDSLHMIPALDKMGLTTLVNESMTITRYNQELGIIGVDDPHFYETDNLEKAMQHVANCPTKILLAHSQELIEKAAAAQINLYLCGHTHGGQICLPGGLAPIKNTPQRYHRYFKGGWTCQNMQGYTPRGIGCSSVTVRFNCRPELTIHRLVRKS